MKMIHALLVLLVFGITIGFADSVSVSFDKELQDGVSVQVIADSDIILAEEAEPTIHIGLFMSDKSELVCEALPDKESVAGMRELMAHIGSWAYKPIGGITAYPPVTAMGTYYRHNRELVVGITGGGLWVDSAGV